MMFFFVCFPVYCPLGHLAVAVEHRRQLSLLLSNFLDSCIGLETSCVEFTPVSLKRANYPWLLVNVGVNVTCHGFDRGLINNK